MPEYIVVDVPKAMQLFCPPGFTPKVEVCHFDCPQMIDRLNTVVRLVDILMDVEKDGGHAMGCKFVKSWPFKGECDCYQSRVRKELHR